MGVIRWREVPGVCLECGREFVRRKQKQKVCGRIDCRIRRIRRLEARRAAPVARQTPAKRPPGVSDWPEMEASTPWEGYMLLTESYREEDHVD